MAFYRKKPVVIEAHELTKDCADRIKEFIGVATEFHIIVSEAGFHSISIETLEGTMRAYEGDFIIKGVNGEFYPCKPDIFYKSYEPSTPPAATQEPKE